jgi:hypothetical protein
LELAAAEAQGATVSYAEQDYPFHSVSNALSRGFAAEARHLYQPDATFSQYQGGSVRLAASPYWQGASAHDRAAEAGKVVGLVRRTLTGPVLLAVEAYYLPNEKSEPNVVFRKQYACTQLIPHVRADISKAPVEGFIADAIGAWAKLCECNNAEWAKELGVNPSTVWRWRAGNQGNRGIDAVLNDWLDLARARLGNPMREYGLIP